MRRCRSASRIRYIYIRRWQWLLASAGAKIVLQLIPAHARVCRRQVHAQKGYEQAAAQAQKGYSRADSFVTQTLAQVAAPSASASGEPAQDAFNEVAVQACPYDRLRPYTNYAVPGCSMVVYVYCI